jgi:tetratricopeptide (TPR) repeat protein
MNSWHSWSPNGKWLVFSSKAHTLYTQLMLTHIDDQGHATPPVVLTHFTAPDKAANIPEFVNTPPTAISRISFDEQFFADAIHLNAGDKYAARKDFHRAVVEYKKAVAANPDNAYGYRAWGIILFWQGKTKEAEERLRKALEIAPEDHYVNWQLGQVLASRGQSEEADRLFRNAIRIDSTFIPAYLDVASLLKKEGRTDQACDVLREAIRIKPDDLRSYCLLGDSLAETGETSEASDMYRKALERNSDCLPALSSLAELLTASAAADAQAGIQAVGYATRACELTKYQDFDALITLSDSHAAVGNLTDAASVAHMALRIATQSGDEQQENMARSRLRRRGP